VQCQSERRIEYRERLKKLGRDGSGKKLEGN